MGVEWVSTAIIASSYLVLPHRPLGDTKNVKELSASLVQVHVNGLREY